MSFTFFRQRVSDRLFPFKLKFSVERFYLIIFDNEHFFVPSKRFIVA